MPQVVLIVEDNKDELNLLTQAMEGKGYTVIAAIDGRTAVKAIDRLTEAPALAILDGSFPGADDAPGEGTKIGAMLRQKFAQVPVLFRSGFIDYEPTDNTRREIIATAEAMNKTAPAAAIGKDLLPEGLQELNAGTLANHDNTLLALDVDQTKDRINPHYQNIIAALGKPEARTRNNEIHAEIRERSDGIRRIEIGQAVDRLLTPHRQAAENERDESDSGIRTFGERIAKEGGQRQVGGGL